MVNDPENKPKQEVPELTENDLGAVTGGAKGDVFLKLDGIEGESLDDHHSKEE
jgi:hypothetical protein